MQKRREARIPVEILSRYRTGSGCAHEVQVSDLSSTGCLLHQNFSALPVGKRLTIRLDTVGPIESIVRWHDGLRIGIEFLQPLHASMLDYLAERFRVRRADLDGPPRWTAAAMDRTADNGAARPR